MQFFIYLKNFTLRFMQKKPLELHTFAHKSGNLKEIQALIAIRILVNTEKTQGKLCKVAKKLRRT